MVVQGVNCVRTRGARTTLGAIGSGRKWSEVVAVYTLSISLSLSLSLSLSPSLSLFLSLSLSISLSLSPSLSLWPLTYGLPEVDSPMDFLRSIGM